MEYTAEQQQVIAHLNGPALVFAVAGSGKTTTLVARAHHLITAHLVSAPHILITTFSRAGCTDLRERCRVHDVTGVQVRTLHSLANTVVSEARDRGLTDLTIGREGTSRKLFEQARRELLDALPSHRHQQALDLRQMTYEDCTTYIGAQKANLCLPYVPDELPGEARALVTPLTTGDNIYAAMYARHDTLRRQQGVMDYDDVIVAAWVLLSVYPDLCRAVQSRFDHIMVDEFQDVSRAQVEMLHLIARDAHSYMAVGDDDQTVYQWRGANPEIILGFEDRYGAVRYVLPQNFRCPVDVVALARRVIEQNSVRAQKTMQATRADCGVTVHSHGSGGAVQVITDALREGRNPQDIVVLLRTYAQSASIEQGLLERHIPYRLVGSMPFYSRPEARVLLAYIELALADLDTEQGHPITQERQRRLIQQWRLVANRPSRYLKTSHIEEVAALSWQEGRSLTQVLEARRATWPAHVREPAGVLAEALQYLSEHLGDLPGKPVLRAFAGMIRYEDYLIRTAPTVEFGRERAEIVGALAEMAQSRSLGDLLTHLAELERHALHQAHLDRTGQDETPRITLMTAFRAKGLQWPCVIVPDCTHDLYRLRPTEERAASEEERRVFYVALTRAQNELHLITAGSETTRFLTDIHHERVLADHARLCALLARPQQWTAAETLAAADVISIYGHIPTVQRWFTEAQRSAVVGRIAALEAGLVSLGAEVPSSLRTDRYAAHGPLADVDGANPFPDLDRVVAALQLPPPAVQAPVAPDALGRTSSAPRPLPPGTRVRHVRFGEGEVLRVERSGGQTVAHVRFGDATHALSLAYVRLEVVQ